MTPNKKAAIEFCMNKYVTNKMVDLFLTIIMTLGLALIIFPIFFWLIYRWYKAKKEMNILIKELNQNPENFKKVYSSIGFGYNRDGEKISNSLELHIGDKTYDIPQLYIWISKYKTKENLSKILNE